MSILNQEYQSCRWCGETHGKICPWVKALEYDAAGTVTRVEFVTAADIKEPPKEEEPPRQSYPRLGSQNAQE